MRGGTIKYSSEESTSGGTTAGRKRESPVRNSEGIVNSRRMRMVRCSGAGRQKGTLQKRACQLAMRRRSAERKRAATYTQAVMHNPPTNGSQKSLAVSAC
jgi:hypothetical protein